MLKNYFKLAYRSLLKYKLSSMINIAGLSVAIGCSLLFFLLLDLEYTSDRFHENAKNIFMVGYTLEGDKQARRWGDSPLPLGPALAEEFPQVKNFARVLDMSAKVHNQNQVFGESIRFVDPSFLGMFTFPLKQGSEDGLADRNSLVLSEQKAIKYFGDENPVGRPLLISFGNKRREPFIVRGVAKKFHHNASFSFGILASLDKWEEILDDDSREWATYVSATFIQVGQASDIEALVPRMDKHIEHINASNFDRPTASFVFEALPTLSWESQEIERSISQGSTPQALILLFVIGLFLLLQACFNYVNISLASASRRNTEIAIRKVVGGQRIQLVNQFLGENLILCLAALFAGLLLTEFVLLPGLMDIMGNVETLSLLDLAGNWHLWLFLAVILLLTGIGAGAYPALVISRFQPAGILGKKAKSPGKKRFTGFLLSFQFGIAFVIICMVVAFLQNNGYQLRRDWGYEQEHVVNIQLETGAQFGILKEAIAQYPGVLEVSGSKHVIGRSGDRAAVEFEGNTYEVLRLDTGRDYLKTLRMRLKEGRFFLPEMLTDLDSAAIVNARFLAELGWPNGVNRTVRFENKLYTVVGVVEDFHHDFFFEDIEPVFIRQTPEEDYRILAVRMEAGRGAQSNLAFLQTWNKLFPDAEFVSFFQDSVFERGFQNNMTVTKIISATAVITLIISCMGLFGLVTLMIQKRMKELSIHKVLGASTLQIAKLISRRFFLLLAAAVFAALPLACIFIKSLLEGIYRYRMPLGAVPFVLAALTVLAAAAATISSQVYKAAVRDPIESIRHE